MNFNNKINNQQIKTSKLGGRYLAEDIDKLDKTHHKILQDLRKNTLDNCNNRCADCFDTNTSWSSVNLGIFLCVRCAQIHRGIGTHISKVKGCGGTYLWYPDEIENMKKIGNEKSNKIYLKKFKDSLPTKNTSDYEIKEHIINKYDKKLWC